MLHVVLEQIRHARTYMGLADDDLHGTRRGAPLLLPAPGQSDGRRCIRALAVDKDHVDPLESRPH